MYKLRVLLPVLGFVCGLSAQQVNLRGKVLDAAGNPVSNAITEIAKLKLKDTTGVDGTFSMTTSITSLKGAAKSPLHGLSFKKGMLEISMKESVPVQVELLDVQGNRLHPNMFTEPVAGSHRIDLREKTPPNQLSLVRVTFGDETYTLPYFPSSYERDAVVSTSVSNHLDTRLAKVTAIIDSLKVTGSGFAAKTIPITNYDSTVNVTVGSAGSKTSPGCGSTTPLKTGSFTESINSTNRKWMIDVPTNYKPNTPYRLIFVWHPLGGSGSQIVNGGFNGLKNLSESTAIFATADGLAGTSSSGTTGNGWWNTNGGDMKLVQVMLDKINASLCIDQERIFSTGFSFGGMMSYTLPFEFDVFRAVAPCSGKTGIIPYTAKFSNPVSIMAFHGDADDFVETELGKAFFDKFAARNQCGTQTKAVTPTGCQQYDGCSVPSTWCVFKGGHATWSEEPAAIWKFFAQF